MAYDPSGSHSPAAQWCFCDSHMQSYQFVSQKGGFGDAKSFAYIEVEIGVIPL